MNLNDLKSPLNSTPVAPWYECYAHNFIQNKTRLQALKNIVLPCECYLISSFIKSLHYLSKILIAITTHLSVGFKPVPSPIKLGHFLIKFN